MTATDRANKWLSDPGDCYYGKAGCSQTAQIMRDLIDELRREKDRADKLHEQIFRRREFHCRKNVLRW